MADCDRMLVGLGLRGPQRGAVMDADLVLEGGGVKGIGLVGAYAALSDAGYTFHRIAGASAGAIVGALIAAGIKPDELETVMRTVDYGRFQDESFIDHLGLVGKGLSILFEKGIYEGKYLREWLDGALTTLGSRTFGDLRIDDPNSSLPPEKAYRLVVMASDVSRGVLARLPWDYPHYGLKADDQLVADAVRASMSIPFFYEPLRFAGHDDAGHEVRSYMVDGGMLSNFPIEVFDRTDGKPPRWPTFGIKLSAKPIAPVLERFEVKGTFGLARAMVGTMTNFHDQMHIDDPSVLARTMFVDTGHVKATDFDIDEPTQDMLFTQGRRGALKFLTTWDFERYVAEFRSGDTVVLPADEPIDAG
jgi:NTE family protein